MVDSTALEAVSLGGSSPLPGTNLEIEYHSEYIVITNLEAKLQYAYTSNKSYLTPKILGAMWLLQSNRNRGSIHWNKSIVRYYTPGYPIMFTIRKSC